MEQDGLAQGLGAFYAAHKQELFTYALSITRSSVCAEDAVHDAFRGILGRNRLPAELRPYVFRCVRNASLDLVRAVERERHKIEGYQSIFQEEEAAPHQETVAEFLALLSAWEREIVVLKVYSGLTFKEIAGVCGSKQGTVAASYWRSLQKLREQVRAAGRAALEPGEQRP